MSKPGRKGVYSEEIVRKIEGYAALGVSDKAIFQAVGISHNTFYKWMKNKAGFAQRIDKARSLGQAKLVKLIWDAVPKTWQAAAWLLERRWSDEFAKKETLKHVGNSVISFSEGLKKVEEHFKSNPEMEAKLLKELEYED